MPAVTPCGAGPRARARPWIDGPGGLREVSRVAFPLILSTASLSLMQFCDRMFLSWYSGVSIRASLPAGILSFTMIFGHLGVPEMGIRGAALATVIAGCVPPAILFGLYFGRAANREFGTRATFRYDPALFRRLLRFGLPSGVHLALDLTSFTLFVLLVGRLGPLAQAASNIALSVNTLAFMPILGLGIAASIVVGQYQGRREPRHAERGGWSALILGTAYMAAIGSTYVLFPELYVRMFAGSAEETFGAGELLPTVRPLLFILAVWSLADAADIVLAGALKGAGDTRFVMAWSLAIAYGFFVTGEIAIVLVFKLGLIPAWLWTCAYIAVLAAGYLWRFKSGRWKSIDLLGRGRSDILPPPGRTGADGMAVE